MKILAVVPIFSETGGIPDILSRFEPGSVEEICLVVDEPRTAMRDELKEWQQKAPVPIKLIVNPNRKGVGHAIKQGCEYALARGIEVIVVMAGNGKDDPSEIRRLTTPILKEGFDYVQGSRFLPGGRRDSTPFLRSIFIRLFPFFWTMLLGVRCTDVTNGFRAYRTSVLRDPRINIWQSWLDNYELEYYLHYKVLNIGYKFAERPVSKIYRHMRRKKYSHISPFKDWWHIVGPLLLLWIGARS